jgi:GNAT superfamily N-acetyltransferase
MIRLATPMDLVDVAQMLIAMREETVWKSIPFTPDALAIEYELLTMLLQPQHRLWVVEEEEGVVGFCGVELLTQRFIPEIPYIQDWGLWVKPTYRGTGLGVSLWQKACAWGQSVGAQGAARGRPLPHGERITFQYWGQTPCLTY